MFLISVGLANADYAVLAKADAPKQALLLYIAGAICFTVAAMLQLIGRRS